MKIIKLKSWKQYVMNCNKSLLDATKKLNQAKKKNLLICNDKNQLIGTLTDADIRRSIINGFHFKCKVNLIINKKPIKIRKSEQIFSIKKDLIEHNVQLLPLVEKNNIIKRVYAITDLPTEEDEGLFQNPVLIMAGGKGERLEELTKNIPKPLLKFNNSSTLQKIIDSFVQQKFSNLSISLCHMAEKIKKKILADNKKIFFNFIEEKKPLGTIGAIAFVDNKINSSLLPIIVINADIISNIDFLNILKFHNDAKADITVAAVDHEIKNPYGVLKVGKKNKIVNIYEKPSYFSIVNAGFYIFSPSIRKLVKKYSHMNIDDLLRLAIKRKKKLLVYKLRNYWHEIGTKKEYYNFQNLIKKN